MAKVKAEIIQVPTTTNEGPQQSDSMAEWSLVELFGHQRIVGHLSTQSFPSGVLFRVDVPDLLKDGKSVGINLFDAHVCIFYIILAVTGLFWVRNWALFISPSNSSLSILNNERFGHKSAKGYGIAWYSGWVPVPNISPNINISSVSIGDGPGVVLRMWTNSRTVGGVFSSKRMQTWIKYKEFPYKKAAILVLAITLGYLGFACVLIFARCANHSVCLMIAFIVIGGILLWASTKLLHVAVTP